jgi:hypothetical protein
MVETRVDKTERRALKVTWVKPEPETFGKYGKKLRFNCADGLQYETIKAHLFPYIKADAELDANCELQIVKFDDGGEMPKWVVVEIYENGEPVKAPTKQGGGQRQYGRDEDRTDQRTFVMEVGQDLRAGLLDKNHRFVKAREIILETWVGIKEEAKPKPKPEPQPAKVEALKQPQTTAVNVEDLKAKLKELFNAKPKKVTGPELVKWGIGGWSDGSMENLSQEKLLEIAREVEGIK